MNYRVRTNLYGMYKMRNEKHYLRILQVKVIGHFRLICLFVFLLSITIPRNSIIE